MTKARKIRDFTCWPSCEKRKIHANQRMAATHKSLCRIKRGASSILLLRNNGKLQKNLKFQIYGGTNPQIQHRKGLEKR